jgi:hypothetical protein
VRVRVGIAGGGTDRSPKALIKKQKKEKQRRIGEGQ